MNYLAMVSAIEGFGEIVCSGRSRAEWRKLLRRQHRLSLRLITKFENVCCGKVSGILPAEYALLVESLQKGYREAAIFEAMDAEKLAEYMQAADLSLKKARNWGGDLPMPVRMMMRLGFMPSGGSG